MTSGPGAAATEQDARSCRVLMVDDDADVLRSMARAMEAGGFAVVTAQSGAEALEDVRRGPTFDVIVSDVAMPEMDGLKLLRCVREHDLDVPVILVTGRPELATAIEAVEHGAFKYLTKPIEMPQLIEVTRRARHVHELARAKRDALAVAGVEGRAFGDRAGLEARFQSGLAGLSVAFQPIVRWSERQAFGYEALPRTREPSLAGPADLMDAALRLGRLHELGRAVRAHVAGHAAEAPPGALLFVGLHPAELNDPELFSLMAPLSEFAERVVLEITERSSFDEVKGLSSRSAKLRRVGYRLALDHLGSGYAGLSSFTQLEPDLVKIDAKLVGGIDASSQKRSIVGTLLRLCARDLGVQVVCDGVATTAERDALAQEGGDLFEGELFGEPARDFAAPQWG